MLARPQPQQAAKQEPKPSEKVIEDLEPAEEETEAVKGGALDAYTSVQGQKQGNFKLK